ncbi:MAG: glycosyltransferase family 2 protein [Bacteroidales bacterium]|nr:glycosyltransferase family 2 protein [Bacteroidales bacterium]
MKVSVIVPVYNVLPYLRRCLDSVVNQTLHEIEIIIVDDGSTDGCAAIVDEYAAKDARITVIHKENGGLMSAWMEGVKASSGDYIGFIDSDDYASCEMYEKLYHLATHHAAEIVMCDMLNESNGHVLKASQLEEGLYEGERMSVIREHIFPIPGQHVVSNARMNKLFKRELIADNLTYCESKSRTFEDRYIVPSAIFSAQRFFYTKQPLYLYYSREGSNSGKYHPDLLGEIMRVYNTQEKMLKEKGCFDEYRTEWEKLFLNYIRLYVLRNIIGRDFKIRVSSANKLYACELAKSRMKAYGSLMNDRVGKALRFSFNCKMPVLLVIASYLA